MVNKNMFSMVIKIGSLGASISPIFVVASCNFFNSSNMDLNSLAENIIISYYNKENTLLKNVSIGSVLFTNFDLNLYEIIDKNITQKNDKNNTITISFKLKNKKNSKVSDKIEKTISNFKVKSTTDEPDKEPESGDKSPNEQSEIKVGHWNIFNFGSSGSGSSLDRENYQVAGISEIIFKSKMDLVGLTEINYRRADSVKKIVDELNRLENDDALWSYVFQQESDANPSSSDSVREQVAIIYKSKIFRPLSFDNNLNGASFTEEFPTVGNENLLRGFVRPVYGHKFGHSKSNKTFTFVFGHFDSPGKGKGSDEQNSPRSFRYDDIDYSLKKSQGQFEVSEAINLSKALEYFNRIDGDSTILFGGDTNIMFNNNSLFKSSIDLGYKLLYDDNENSGEKYATSLRRPTNLGYSQPYDKIIFKEADGVDVIDETENPELMFKVDIINAFNNGMLDRSKYENLWYDNKTPTIAPYITAISDHTLVFAKIIIG